MNTDRMKQVAVMVNHLGNPFEASLVSLVESELMKRQCRMLLQTYRQEAEETWTRSLADCIDGLILIGQTLQDTTASYYDQRGVPIVSMLRPAWENKTIPYVDMNWIRAMRKIIEYLQGRGHQEIGFMTNGNPAHYHTQRFSAFIQAMQLCKGRFEHANVLNGGGTYLKAYDAMEGRLGSGELPFTALICANDLMAIGAMAACRNHGVAIPGKLAVIGCEDILMSSETNPPLTTIQYSREAISRAAVDILFARLTGVEASPPAVEGLLLIRSSG